MSQKTIQFFFIPLLVAIISSVIYFLRRSGQSSKSPGSTVPSNAAKPLVLSDTPDKPQAFGYKCCWLAIRTYDSAAVLQALNLKNQQPANWATGIGEASNLKGVFVTPPIDGWILVVGALPDSGDGHSPDLCTPFLQTLSEQLGEIQYFGTHRGVDYHGWATVKAGKIVRAYAYWAELETNVWNTGELTEEEKALGLIFDNDKTPNEEDVMNIAEKWSLNPQNLEQMNLKEGVVVFGEL